MNDLSTRILYVDDDHPVLEMIRPSLQLLGHDVVTIDNPLEALDLFRADPYRFDLVITDMSMPEMDGGRLATSLLAIRPDLPVIMCHRRD
jgi:CheY-like chemotaxis protein